MVIVQKAGPILRSFLAQKLKILHRLLMTRREAGSEGVKEGKKKGTNEGTKRERLYFRESKALLG